MSLTNGRPPRRIAICLPTLDSVDYQFAICLAEMCAAVTGTLGADGIADIFFADVEGAPVDKARNDCVRQAIKGNATHLLWLDTDMLFPRNTLHKLLAANADIVGCNYVTRRPPCRPVTYKRLPNIETGDPGEHCYTRSTDTGYEEVEGIGGGVVLMRADLFADIAEPAFDYHWQPNTKTWCGEDIDFCRKARAKGYNVLIDHDLSKQIGHVGRFIYTHPLVEDAAPPKVEVATPSEVRRLKLEV